MPTVQLACLTLPYARYPLERGLQGVAAAGFRFVGLGWPHEGQDPLGLDPEGIQVHKACEACEGAGLTPIVISGGSTPTQSRAEGLHRRIDVATTMGATLIQLGGAGRYRRFPDEPLPEDQFQEAHRTYVADLRSAGEYADGREVTLALKPHTGNTATAEHLKRLLPEIDRSSVKACYDPGNVRFYEGISPETDFPAIAHQTAEIVAKDHRGERANRDFPIPGEGDIEWDRIYESAFKAGFIGPVVVERVDGTDGNRPPEDLDARIARARDNLLTVLTAAGFGIE